MHVRTVYDPFLIPDHTGLAHATPPPVGIVAGTPVQDTAVVPDHGVAGSPAVGVDILRPGGSFEQIVKQPPAVDARPAGDREGADAVSGR